MTMTKKTTIKIKRSKFNPLPIVRSITTAGAPTPRTLEVRRRAARGGVPAVAVGRRTRATPALVVPVSLPRGWLRRRSVPVVVITAVRRPIQIPRVSLPSTRRLRGRRRRRRRRFVVSGGLGGLFDRVVRHIHDLRHGRRICERVSLQLDDEGGRSGKFGGSD